METAPGERRVALVPESAKKLIQAGYEVAIETGAGEAAGYPDAAYREVGAAVESDAASLLGSGDLILKVGPPASPVGGGRDEVAWMRPGAIYLGSLMPLRNPDAARALADRGITAFATDAIPRTTRAQAMDTLSSMANIAGYKGVLLAAGELNKYFPMLMTAAGMVPPAKVFVIGAAVAGLQAIATAKRLGANVVATDVRPEVKEQIESVGGKYVGIELGEAASAGGGYARELSEADKARQRELLAAQVAQSDVVITTALIGGVFAPRLLTAEMVRSMRPGSVIVDLAADGGGNCELS
ncbi:MAG TPA: NAD(P) transhydrogenase subunit alpha, partial [Gemmatimonadales bacterium]|nr:NAD(P) transhydrogenase subunit alpha [Gemmatimonadales bacterium]